MHYFRKIIFTLIAITLLFGSSSTNSTNIDENSEIFSLFQDIEEDDSEIKNIKFVENLQSELEIIQLTFTFENHDSPKLDQNFSSVLSSPPNC